MSCFKVPLGKLDRLTSVEWLKNKWKHYKKLEAVRKRIEEDDSGEETVILEAKDLEKLKDDGE